MAEAPIDITEKVEKIVDKDSRFRAEAYIFVMITLDHVMSALPERRHITGQELLCGVKELAIVKYGPMAKTVLDHWGVKKTEDIGDIVFNLVDVGVLTKTETDRREDFLNGYDFEEVFVKDLEW